MQQHSDLFKLPCKYFNVGVSLSPSSSSAMQLIANNEAPEPEAQLGAGAIAGIAVGVVAAAAVALGAALFAIRRRHKRALRRAGKLGRSSDGGGARLVTGGTHSIGRPSATTGGSTVTQLAPRDDAVDNRAVYAGLGVLLGETTLNASVPPNSAGDPLCAAASGTSLDTLLMRHSAVDLTCLPVRHFVLLCLSCCSENNRSKLFPCCRTTVLNASPALCGCSCGRSVVLPS